MKRPKQKSRGRFSMFEQLQATLPNLNRNLPGRLLYSRSRLSALLAITLTSSTFISGQVNVSSSAQPNLPRLKWTKPTGAERYRLQIARDDRFNDVLFDGIVSGEEYLVKDLLPGSYYWRLTSLESGKALRPATRFEVKSNVTEERLEVGIPGPGARRVPLLTGWLAATGEISSVVAQLRTGSTPDIVGLNVQGTVYAIDGRTGVARWINRNKRDAGVTPLPANPPNEFRPVIVNADATRVIVSFDGGLRAIESSNGKEIWTRDMPGRFLGGSSADLDSKPGTEIYLTNSRLYQLISLDPATGAVLSQTTLTRTPVGPPVLLQTDSSSSLIVPLQGDAIEVRKANGEYLRTVRTNGNLTTAPIVARTTRGTLILVGTSNGLATFDANSFAPLEPTLLYGGDYPTGTLSVAPPGASGFTETLIMLSNLGRVIAVNLADGKVRWSVDGFAHAVAAAFADINSDGQVEMLLPGNRGFVTALSIDDGSLIWLSDEGRNDAAAEPTRSAGLTTLSLKDGGMVIVGNDVAGIGLRALLLSAPTPAETPK